MASSISLQSRYERLNGLCVSVQTDPAPSVLRHTDAASSWGYIATIDAVPRIGAFPLPGFPVSPSQTHPDSEHAPTPSGGAGEAPAAFHHNDSDAIRFWVPVADDFVGASIRRAVLQICFRPQGSDEEPMATYTRDAAELGAAVQRRVAKGSIEPVMPREFDLRPEAVGAGPGGA